MDRLYCKPLQRSPPSAMQFPTTHPQCCETWDSTEIYGEERAPELSAPELVGYHMDALLPYWDDMPVSTIKSETCRAYVKQRTVKPATARRELETLSAALTYCAKEGYLTSVPLLTYPAKALPRTRWLTKNEASRLLWAARKHKHLTDFILIGLYTGTRSGAILGLQWMPNTTGEWVDLERGLLFRKSDSVAETNKRQHPCSIPTKLLARLKRIRKRTRRHVIEYQGKPVKKLKRSWGVARRAAGLDKYVVPHVLRHTCATWLMQAGVPKFEAAGFLSMSEKTLEATYGHHHPDFQKAAREAK